MDPSRHNGATLAGLRGVVIKSHGGTNIEGFISAIHVAVEEAKLQLPERILAAVSKLNDDLELMVSLPRRSNRKIKRNRIHATSTFNSWRCCMACIRSCWWCQAFSYGWAQPW